MFSHVKLFSLLRVTVAYRFMGRRMLLDKLTCGAAGTRWQARHLILEDSLSGTVFLKYRSKTDPENCPNHIDSVLNVFTRTATNNMYVFSPLQFMWIDLESIRPEKLYNILPIFFHR